MAESVDDPQKFQPNDTGPLDVSWACPGCGSAAAGAVCRGCGRLRYAHTFEWPAVGTSISGFRLNRRLPRAGEGAWYQALRGTEAVVLLITQPDDPHDLHGAWRRSADACDLVMAPTAVAVQGWRVSSASAPIGPSLSEILAGARTTPPTVNVLGQVERLVYPLVQACAAMHVQDAVLGMVNPEHFIFTDAGFRTLLPPPKPEAPLRRLIPGFSGPEHAGHCGGRLDAHSDVFFCGMVLYYLLTRVRPLAETAAFEHPIPSAHVYQDNLPPGLCAVVRRATSPIPSRRYVDGSALFGALERAINTARLRAAAVRGRRLGVDIGHERHIGVLKGQYAPVNQDDLFLGYHAPTGIGLFTVADGVSISRHGTGDQASACVRQSATSLWHAILEGRPGDVSIEDETVDGFGESSPAIPEEESVRRGMLKQMIQQANTRIGELVHIDRPRFIGPPEGIMASTTVTVLLDQNRATLMSIGDSRIYLVRDGHIASLMVDHDLATQLVRMGRPPSLARAVPSAAALVRCVGEFEKDSDDRLVAADLNPGFRSFTLLPGDSLVLCSDGIPDYGGFDHEDADDRIREIVETADGARWAAFELMVLANRGGGGDNISCIVLNFGEPYVEPA